MNNKIKTEVALGVILIVASILGSIFWLENKKEAAMILEQDEQQAQLQLMNKQSGKQENIPQEQITLNNAESNSSTPDGSSLIAQPSKQEIYQPKPTIKTTDVIKNASSKIDCSFSAKDGHNAFKVETKWSCKNYQGWSCLITGRFDEVLLKNVKLPAGSAEVDHSASTDLEYFTLKCEGNGYKKKFTKAVWIN